MNALALCSSQGILQIIPDRTAVSSILYNTHSQSNPVAGPFFDLRIFRTPEGLSVYQYVYGAVMTTGHHVAH